MSPAYKNNSLISVGYFKPEDELDLPANRMSMAEIKANTNNQENPFGNYFFASKTKVNEKEVEFEFNKEKKGWQYNWISSKANRDLKVRKNYYSIWIICFHHLTLILSIYYSMFS